MITHFTHLHKRLAHSLILHWQKNTTSTTSLIRQQLSTPLSFTDISFQPLSFCPTHFTQPTCSNSRLTNHHSHQPTNQPPTDFAASIHHIIAFAFGKDWPIFGGPSFSPSSFCHRTLPSHILLPSLTFVTGPCPATFYYPF